MKLKLIVFVILFSQATLAKNLVKTCRGGTQRECLHQQGLYTDEELENLDIEKVEMALEFKNKLNDQEQAPTYISSKQLSSEKVEY